MVVSVVVVDTIKVRLQTSGKAEGRFTGSFDCLRTTLRQV